MIATIARPRETRMPDDQTPRTKAPTWLDLMPADAPMPELLAHDELLAAVHDRGVELTSSGLEYYRHRTLLPRPIRRRHQGKTQAVYPSWYVDAIVHLKRLQAQDQSLDEIRPAMWDWLRLKARGWVRWSVKDPLREPTANLQTAMETYARAVQPWLDGRTIDTIRVVLVDDAENEIPDFGQEIRVV